MSTPTEPESSRSESDSETGPIPSDSDIGFVTTELVLADDSLPATEGLFPTETRPFDAKEHKAKTRKTLALSSLGVVIGYHVLLVGLLGFNVITMDEFTGVMAASTGLQALAAVAFTFYFAKS